MFWSKKPRTIEEAIQARCEPVTINSNDTSQIAKFREEARVLRNERRPLKNKREELYERIRKKGDSPSMRRQIDALNIRILPLSNRIDTIEEAIRQAEQINGTTAANARAEANAILNRAPAYTYVLQSPASPELVKVGKATTLTARARQLNQESHYAVSIPYEIVFAIRHPGNAHIEFVAHGILEELGAYYHNELFKCPAEDAQEAVLCAAGYIDNRWRRGNISFPSDISIAKLAKNPKRYVARGKKFTVDLSDRNIAHYNKWAREEAYSAKAKTEDRVAQGWSLLNLFRPFTKPAPQAAVFKAKKKREEQIARWREKDAKWERKVREDD